MKRSPPQVRLEPRTARSVGQRSTYELLGLLNFCSSSEITFQHLPLDIHHGPSQEWPQGGSSYEKPEYMLIWRVNTVGLLDNHRMNVNKRG